MDQSSRGGGRHGARGSSIVPTLIIVLGLAVLSVAAINMAWRGTLSAAHKSHGDQLTACANAAAQRVLAEYALAGANVGSITATGIPGGPTLGLGHFDAGMTVNIAGSLTELGTAAGGQTQTDFDTTNTITKGRGGGKPYSLVAHCTDPQGRQYEVELFLRLGLM
jgi:hypothetical protein